MSIPEIPSQYQSKEIEKKWYELWESSGFFSPKIDSARRPFTIVIPPPNVTGILHMGHALNNTIQDILIRWQRMKGNPALWVPGVDHAGIATQNVVEKKLAQKKISRHNIGREKFVEEVWKWKEEYGSTIVRQLRRLGASCDWSRERFTMDEQLSRAVREAFVRLYEKGLVYRGNYIINWCPRCQTALSDEEAVHQDVQGNFYYVKYPIEKSDEHVLIATTRPETMLGDTGVAMNPADERYQHLRGKKLILPLLGRVIPMIEDELVDPQFGTGLVKVTPAHDPNDFTMGTRHKLEFINILNPDGTINENGGPYKGLDRFEARKRVLEDLEKAGLLEKTEKHQHAVGHCYRCHTVVEPYLSKQWFVKMKPLAEPAMRAVQDGKISFAPERWTKVYLNWLENIRDWCISRQIWWGHQIPVWYCEKCQLSSSPNVSVGDPQKHGFPPKTRGNDNSAGVIVSREDPEKCPTCGGKNLKRDPDVLDTWFSSWLWPFSTLGWPASAEAPAGKPASETTEGKPDQINDLKYFYPTSVLVTAPEIIFFWVARMIMAGYEFMGQEPFEKVIIHGTVRVEGGKKMSKSLGNSIDPLEIIDEMGADALRFSLMILAATDVYLSRQKFEQGRNFTNKIWNAFRFCMNNLGDFKPEGFMPVEKIPAEKLSDIDKWILTELQEAADNIDMHLEGSRLSEAANSAYHFFWHSFCDWYLELAKPVLTGLPDGASVAGEPSERRTIVQNVLVCVLEAGMRLLHPFMPFITEEIRNRLKTLIGGEHFEAPSIMLAVWPDFTSRFEKEANEVRMFQEAVGGIRDLRTKLGLKPSETVPHILVAAKSGSVRASIAKFQAEICHLTKVEELKIEEKIQKAAGMVGKVFSHMEIFVTGLSESQVAGEIGKIRKSISELERLIVSVDARLASPQFTGKAPEEIVEKERERKADFEKQLASYRENLALFGKS